LALDDGKLEVASWAYSSLQPEVANSATAAVSAPLSMVPRLHGNIRLTPVAHAFLAYWWHIRGEKIIPYADDVSPPQMRTLAPYVRYMHWDGDALVHRLWGSALTEGIGLDMTGHDVMTYIPPDIRDANRRMFRSLSDHPCGFVVVTRNDSRSAGGVLSEMTFLPVSAPDGQSQRLIGTMQWRDAHSVHDCLPIESDKPQSLHVEKLAFIDVGAGTADAALLDEL